MHVYKVSRQSIDCLTMQSKWKPLSPEKINSGAINTQGLHSKNTQAPASMLACSSFVLPLFLIRVYGSRHVRDNAHITHTQPSAAHHCPWVSRPIPLSTIIATMCSGLGQGYHYQPSTGYKSLHIHSPLSVLLVVKCD